MKKTVLITGTSSGIGKAAARTFAARGWNVVATQRRPKDAGDLAGLDGVLTARLDVRDGESIRSAVEAGISRFGRIDALVNNAGFSLYGALESISPGKIREQFEVNVLGVMEVTRALLPHFRANKGGLILNVGSRAGTVGLPLLSLYCATKFALEGFSEALAFELASQNITVKIVSPGGGADTRFGRRMKEEAAQNMATPDYDAFAAGVAAANAGFAKMREGRATRVEDIAEVLLGAATDGTDRLRYPVGLDIPPFLKAKREMPDQDYVEFMRAQFRGF